MIITRWRRDMKRAAQPSAAVIFTRSTRAVTCCKDTPAVRRELVTPAQRARGLRDI